MNDKQTIPAQSLDNMPGNENEMTPEPDYTPRYPGCGKLESKTALITGGDSGIGRAVAALFALRRRERGHCLPRDEHEDDHVRRRRSSRRMVCEALLIAGDIGEKAHASDVVEKCVERFGGLDIVINNAAVQYFAEDLRDIEEEQLQETMRTNVMAYFFITQAALNHLGEGSCIINTSSVNAFKGNATLVDYSTTRGGSTCLFPLSCQAATAEEDPGQHRCPGPDLDAIHSGIHASRQGRGLRQPGTDGACRDNRGKLLRATCSSPVRTATS